jgi:hypothetical protein
VAEMPGRAKSPMLAVSLYRDTSGLLTTANRLARGRHRLTHRQQGRGGPSPGRSRGGAAGRRRPSSTSTPPSARTSSSCAGSELLHCGGGAGAAGARHPRPLRAGGGAGRGEGRVRLLRPAGAGGAGGGPAALGPGPRRPLSLEAGTPGLLEVAPGPGPTHFLVTGAALGLASLSARCRANLAV